MYSLIRYIRFELCCVGKSDQHLGFRKSCFVRCSAGCRQHAPLPSHTVMWALQGMREMEAPPNTRAFTHPDNSVHQLRSNVLQLCVPSGPVRCLWCLFAMTLLYIIANICCQICFSQMHVLCKACCNAHQLRVHL